MSGCVLREAFLVLATLAIVLKILIPAGMMPNTAPHSGPSFALVLCTGQGPMVMPTGDALAGHEDRDTPPGQAHDRPCLFAGHGLGAPPPNLIDVAAVERVAYAVRPLADIVHLAPGRGLAGPPLPARGPPASFPII